MRFGQDGYKDIWNAIRMQNPEKKINHFEIETDFEIEFIGRDGGDYILFDEDDEGIGPAPWKPFVVELPKKEDEK